MAEEQLFYVGQKALIEKDGKVLVLQIRDLGGDFPGGKVQVGETDFIAALKREVKEETCLEIEVGEPFLTGYFKFTNQEDWKKQNRTDKKVFIVVYKAMLVAGDITLSKEHSSYEWVSKETYMQSVATLDDDGPIKVALEKFFSS
ncbi:MAG: NUDIX domain-containing protein [Candidatus Levyibacteriota bacterium]